MDKCHFAIIGGGVAGLVAAISAARANENKNAKILILESGAQCGSKLLLSGSGQCNFTHAGSPDAFLVRCREYKNYLKPAYFAFSNTDFIKLLNDAGCPSLTREDNKVFPSSLRATDVRDCLLNMALKLGVRILYNAQVSELSKTTDGSFIITTDNYGKISSSRLLIATGGGSYPQTGSDGRALRLVKSLGHNPIPFRAHLCGVHIKSYAPYIQCAGISLPDAKLKFWHNDMQFCDNGDLLFTHSGLSGPVIMDNCYRILAGMSVYINLLADSEFKLTELLEQNRSAKLISALIKMAVPRRLMSTILETNGFDPSQMLATMSKKDINRLNTLLTDVRFEISRTGAIETAMASAGGIPLSEVNSKTMQSRICSGLFFAGEVLDYALPTGGFNIQMAASTAWLAGLKQVVE